MKPKFSIIIALAPDREIVVLESLEKMNFLKEAYEVIIETGGNPSINRNRGIEKAKGQILAFVDDDCIIERNWLKNAKEFLDSHKDVDIVGGPQLTPVSDKTFARLSGYVFSSSFGAYKMSSRYRCGRINLHADEWNLTSANFFVKKNLFGKISSFDIRLFPNEETEFLHRAKDAGYRIAYCPDIVVYHKRRDNFSAFLKQILGYGKGRARQDMITHSLPKLWVVISSFFIIYLFLLPFIFLLTPFFILPFLIYWGISIAAAGYISVRNKDVLVMVSYPILCFLNHCAYPLGYVYERIRIIFSKHLKERE